MKTQHIRTKPSIHPSIQFFFVPELYQNFPHSLTHTRFCMIKRINDYVGNMNLFFFTQQTHIVEVREKFWSLSGTPPTHSLSDSHSLSFNLNRKNTGEKNSGFFFFHWHSSIYPKAFHVTFSHLLFYIFLFCFFLFSLPLFAIACRSIVWKIIIIIIIIDNSGSSIRFVCGFFAYFYKKKSPLLLLLFFPFYSGLPFCLPFCLQ